MAYVDSSISRQKTPLSLVKVEDSATDEDQKSEIEVESETSDEKTGELGGFEGSLVENLVNQISNPNLAEDLDQEVLDKLGPLVVQEYQIDETSRSDWKTKTEHALKFANQETTPKQYPFPNASNVVYPLITTAAMQFAARTYPALIQSRNVVKGVVWGSDKGTPATDVNGQPETGPDGNPVWVEAPGAKRLRADKIGAHMSYQLLEEMPEWEPQTDLMLHMIPIAGGAARKTYYDPVQDRNYSLLVPLLDLVWNMHAKSFESAPRHTEILRLYPLEIEENERAGVFLEIVYGNAVGTTVTKEGEEPPTGNDPDAPHVFLEQHRTYDLDGDGYPEPYICTVHLQTQKVVRVVARYEEDGISADIEKETGAERITRIAPTEHYTLIPFLPDPKGGSYPIGFGHLLRPLNESINTSLNQMFDAGHLQNAGGGFIGSSLSLASGPINFRIGMYVPVNNKGVAIRDSVFPMPFAGPSPVLFQLLGVLLQAGKDVASIQDILTGDSSMANQPPTTVLALIEQGLKLYTSIHKRVYRAFKSEFDKLYRLNRRRLSEPQRFKIGDEWMEVTPDDYRLGGGVEPIADPTMVTDMQRLGRAQILLQFNNDPLINQIELRRRFLDATMIDRIDELLVTNPQLSEAQKLEVQRLQAEISRMQAAELRDRTQAIVNLANAKATATDDEVKWIEQQLEVMRLHIEAANAMIRAADVDIKGQGKAETGNAKKAASNVANREPTLGGGGAGIPGVAPLAPNQGIPPVPLGPGGGL